MTQHILKLTLVSMALSLNAYATEVEEITQPSEIQPYQQALELELADFRTKFDCQPRSGGIIPSNEGQMIPTVVRNANRISISRSGSANTISASTPEKGINSVSENRRYQAVLMMSEDEKEVSEALLQYQELHRVNNGTLSEPQMNNEFQTIRQVRCIKK